MSIGGNRPVHQLVIRWATVFLTAIAAVGATMDALSNAISLVRPQITYVSTPIVVMMWLLVEMIAATVGIPWKTGGRRMRIRRLPPKIRLGVIAILVLLWVPRIGDLPRGRTEIPPIQVELVNTTYDTLSVDRQGEFVLWLPSALYDGAPRVGGKFVFRAGHEASYTDSPLVLPPRAGMRVAVDLLADQLFLVYLQREDTDLSLVVGTSVGLQSSGNMPFMREAIAARYLQWRLGG
jgi:hypothetical protein